ncbi:MAG: cytochrome c maturation protein CcmE [Dehalococcoidia bacterium]
MADREMAGERQVDAAIDVYNPWLTPRKKLIAGGIVLAVAFASIIYVVTVNTGQFFLDVSEVQQKGSLLFGKDIRVNGIVVPGSIVYGEEKGVSFQVLDTKKKSGQPLDVVFPGVPPGQFDVPSVEVVLEGRLEPDKVFHITSIITRESRKYIPITEE